MPLLRFTSCAFALTSLLRLAPLAAQSVEQVDLDHLELRSREVSADAQRPDLAQAVQEIIAKTNAFRESEGLRDLKENEHLRKAAQYFADYMARTNRYGHHADGKRPADRAAAHDYEYCIVLENIAYQYNSLGFATGELAGKFFTGWKNSPGHRKNMLNPYIYDTGVAIARSEEHGYYFAVQMFGRPQSQHIEARFFNETKEAAKYTLSAAGEEGEAQRTFELPPGMVRAHQRCRPAKFRFGWMKENAWQDVEDGKTYVVGKSGDGEFSISTK